MGAAVIGVVFLAGLIGVPSLFGHGNSGANRARPQATQQQAAAAPAPASAPAQIAEVGADASTFAYTRAGERP
ncbi:hypothetical protein WJ542_25250 [Paraburkholderia sp. B3]|uniref:hypothetical protein n=1 Tax=Paraburkholderia sp. B3 TaxID=3134791 RepID=UPI003982641C